ncbi:MAG: hypothetical protein Q8Q11_01870 [bacterium]|nr:hypothetical protein [bacterium]MDZ4247803.1 hypothetical protein [Patescibacteria group bacterium]
MTGKGWIVIYAVLLLMLLYLFVSVSGLKGDVNELRADVADLQQDAAAVTTPSPAATSSETEAPVNDLATAAGRDAQRKYDLGKIAEALGAYKEARGAYPAGLNELTPNYMGRLPTDPNAPQFNYRYKRTPEGFRLTCVLEQTDDPDDAKGDGKTDKVFTLTEDLRSGS